MHALVSDALVCKELAGAEEATAVGAAEAVVPVEVVPVLPEPYVVPLVRSAPMATVTSL
jgi:hypothetical protein